MSNRDTARAWAYHDFTKHSYWSIRTTAHYLDWSNMPSPFKIYPELEPIALSNELSQTAVPALEAIASRGPEPNAARRITLDQLGNILYFSAGVTKKKDGPGGTIYFRAAACAGALYPTEIYVVSGDIEGLPAGVYHFNPGDFSLRRLREGDYRAALIKAGGRDPHTASAPVVLVFTAISWRSSWKYRDRSYRYHFWDNGMILANALAMAAAHDLPARLVMGFIEAEVNKLVGIDGTRELALSMLALGHDETTQQPAALIEDLPALSHQVLPLSDSEVDYESIREMHEASSLTSQSEVEEWREAGLLELSPARSEPRDNEVSDNDEVIKLTPLAPDLLPGESIEEVIQRRASTRRFALKPIGFAELSVMLDRASGAIAADFLGPDFLEPQINDLYMIVNRVDGLEPGAYFYRREDRALVLLKRGDFAEKARYLTLEQDLGGDAAVTFFFMADLSRVLDRLGNRGYRAAQMEAGITGGKIYLAAYALKRGATGLTFYDDDVTEFFSPHAAGKSCIFVTSVGIPGKRPIF